MRERRVGSLGAAAGTNNTHASVEAPPDADALAIEFRATAIGATPTVTWVVQGSDDGPEVTDANSDWYALFGLPAGGAAETAIGGTVTTVSDSEFFVELARRPVRKVRLITSANTNVTYDSELRAVSHEEE